MSKLRAILWLSFGVLPFPWACGGSDQDAVFPHSAGTATDAPSSGDSGSGADSGTVETSTADSATDAGSDALQDSSMLDATDAEAGACANVFGRFDVVTTIGPGCGNLNTQAPQCVEGTTAVCAAHFVSVVDGGVGAINGVASIQPSGSFSGASLYFGTAQRTGCSGTWNGAYLQVSCGAGGDLCQVTLVKDGPSCP